VPIEDFTEKRPFGRTLRTGRVTRFFEYYFEGQTR
jgi:hypothetical protein